MERMETTTAPGLSWRPRKDGKAAYWIANPAAIKAGYKPNCVRLGRDGAGLAARCHVLQAEMLEWLSRRQESYPRTFNGKLASLVHLYETDHNSPYQDLKPATQRTYSSSLAQLMLVVGARKISAVTGADTYRWFKLIVERNSEGYANYIITALKSALNYGILNELEGCKKLREAMNAVKFPDGAPRQVRMTPEHWEAFCRTAQAMQEPSMALGLSLQFLLFFRARDVIGEWIRDESGGDDGIRRGKWLWRDGLTWSHIGLDGIMRKKTSKTGTAVAHRLDHYPTLVRLLACVPGEHSGPLVICERTQLPYTADQYRSCFRRIRSKAGISSHIWKMDARGGGVTDAFELGAEVRDTMATAAHTNAQTTWRYNKDTVALTDRVHKLRGAKYNLRG